MPSAAAEAIAAKHNAGLTSPGVGHNSAGAEAPATRFAKDQLKAFCERVERLEEEKKTFTDDIREVFAEAKAHGFDVKALRAIIKLRKQDADERKEHEAIVETYRHALGMLD